jgi:aspartyl-tRNA(Asn)/glutamyl-tRNA(Gln) amidotransferase subunit B
VRLIGAGKVSNKIAKDVFAEMFATGKRPGLIVAERGLTQISDAGELETAVGRVVAANPQALADYRAGKAAALSFLVGQVMKETKGRANPALVNQLLLAALSGEL